jgi:1-phosphofructokinase
MKIATVTLNPAIDRSIIYDNEFLSGELNRVNSATVNAGGKGVNVSRMLKKLGKNSEIFGFEGGYVGQMLCSMLKEEGLDNSFTKTLAETRMNIKITDKNGKETEINENGGPVSQQELDRLLEALKKSESDVFIIGGSTPKGLPEDTVKQIVGILKARGKTVICDISGQPLKYAVENKPYLIKPNRQEFCDLIGHTPEDYVMEAINFYNSTGIEILLTLGKKGAVYSGRAGNCRVVNPEIIPKGFTGAGDTFLASYVYMLSEEKTFCEAIQFASAASLSKVELEGTNLPDIEHIKSNFDKISVTQL